jgi:cyanuric acid amidohydrolase
MRAARIESPIDVHFVQVKGPCLTSEQIAAGGDLVSDSPDKSMMYSRIASALGVALALGEIHESELTAALAGDRRFYSNVASTSAGVEVQPNEVVVLGMSRHWSGSLRIQHRSMADALDIGAVHGVLADLGIDSLPQVSETDRARLRAVLVKCEPSRDGLIHGQPHTMWNDGDINPQRHIRSAVGAIVAAVTGDTRVFVSGGAEHQGPDGGGLLAVIASRA